MGVALVIVWIIFMVITLMYTTDIGKEIYRMVEDNTLLKLIYDGNPIMKLATEILKCKRVREDYFRTLFITYIF